MNVSEKSKPDHGDHGHDDHHILVAVQTTSGRWPEQGFEGVAGKEPVEAVLNRARHQLDLVGVIDWIAIVGDKTLDVHQSFATNGLTGQVLIQYGPPAGGGGSA